MSAQSTREKGDSLSDHVYANALDIAKKGGLAVPASYCKVYREKGYFGNLRKKKIYLDVSIEVWAPDAPRWTMLWAFECKNYGRTVPVTALETFSAHLDQVAPFNRKGVMVSNSAYSNTALEFARNSGMALVRLLPDDQVDYVMFRGLPTSGLDASDELDEDDIDALTDPDYVGLNRSFFGTIDDRAFADLDSLLRHASNGETLAG